MKKVIIVRADNPEILAQKIEEADCFASQVFQDRLNNTWCAFLYFNEKEQENIKQEKEESHRREKSPTKNSPATFKFNPAQAKKWKDESVTINQRKLLKKYKLTDKEINDMSKLDAYYVISGKKK